MKAMKKSEVGKGLERQECYFRKTVQGRPYQECYLNRDLCEMREGAMGSSGARRVQVGGIVSVKALRWAKIGLFRGQ